MLAAKQGNTNKKNEPIIVFIYDHYRNDMYRAAKAIVRESHLAEDIVQEGLLRKFISFITSNRMPCGAIRF